MRIIFYTLNKHFIIAQSLVVGVVPVEEVQNLQDCNEGLRVVG